MEVHIARDGQRIGAWSLEEVRRQLAAGTLLPTDLAWTEGMAQWVTLAALPGLSSETAAPPPQPTPGGFVPGGVTTVIYAAPQTSGAAVVSLVFGVVSLVCCMAGFPAGIVAIICGHIARRNIRQSEGRLTGNGMAIAGLAIGYLEVNIALLLVLNIVAQTKANERKSVANAKSIVAACRAYAADHENAFPKKLDELVPKYLPDQAKLTCPLSPSEPIGYEYFGGTTQDPPGKVLLQSKYKDWRGRRIVAHVDGSCALEKIVDNIGWHISNGTSWTWKISN